MKTPTTQIDKKTGDVALHIESLTTEEKHELRSSLSALVRSSGWKTLLGVVDSQVQVRNLQLLQPLANSDAIYACEHRKGVVNGSIGVTDLPHTLLDQLNEDLKDED